MEILSPLLKGVGYLSISHRGLEEVLALANCWALEHLEKKRNLALIADYIAFNYPKGLSLTDWDAVGKQNLSDHYKREEVYQVFKNMYENPYFDENDKKQGGHYIK